MKRSLVIILTFAALAAACGATSPTTSRPTTAGETSAPTTVATPPGDIGTIVRIFDGDSFEAEVNGVVVEVRMLGINAPEGSECHGNVARSRLQELLEDTEFTLVQQGEDDTDRFGRLLRSVYAKGMFINGTMVAEGHAIALQGGAPEEATLVDLSDTAFTEARGMWASDACSETIDRSIRIIDVEYDPAGRDWQNKSEEWVVVRNAGDTATDMAGWILRDESSTHRYGFPNGLSLGPGDEMRIRTGCGEDGGTDLYWCADDAVWSNGGDTVILQSPAGTVIDRLRYDGDY